MTTDNRGLAGLDVSRETFERLEVYEALLAKWNPAINLVAKGTLGEAWSRHFIDSAQVLSLAPPEARIWLDVGSGGGFPGMVVAIIAAELRPDLSITLVDSDLRKSAFLGEVARNTGVAVTINAVRAEELPPANADVMTARAFAPLTTLLSLASRHLNPQGRGIFLKGARHEAEVSDALESFRFDLQKVPSQTDPQAVILSVGGITRV
ncbi:MAG: 16S rRNA (guanine(527)-N(7))-methyltransferase RsmG [Proteobacteria bacterium]|nr:16S rRNA (guanine(527)-N(7))-methyltransferase RsmG [Pseudomonadota bacterium]